MTAMKEFAIPGVSPFLDDDKEHRRQMASRINTMLGGGLNVVAEITLRASQTTTTIIDDRIRYSSFIELSPLTSSAATAKQSAYVPLSTITKGQAVIQHASNAATDQNFRVLIVG